MVKRSSNRQTYIIVGLIALIIFLLLTLIDFSAVFDFLLSADWRLLGASAVVLVLSYVFLALRWRYLLGNRHSYRDMLNVTGSGYMFGILVQLPTTVYRVLVMERKSMAKVTETSSAIAVEVLLSLILRMIGAVVVISLLVARSKEAENFLVTSISIVIGLLVLMFLVVGLRDRLEPVVANILARLPKMEERQAKGISESVFRAAAMAGSPKRFGMALLFSLCYWLCGFGFYAFAVYAFSLDEKFQVLAIAAAAMTVVPVSSPMMIGVYHGLLIATLIALKLGNTTDVTSYAIVVHLIQMAVLLLLGSWGLRSLKLNPREIIHDVRAQMRREDVEATS
jgi:uncharacterized membrane protein YbhN (UPF0104 family)